MSANTRKLSEIQFVFKTTKIVGSGSIHFHVKGPDGSILVNGRVPILPKINLNLKTVTPAADTITSSIGLYGRVDMTANGDSSWGFDLDICFVFCDGQEEKVALHSKELHCCNGSTDGFELSF